MASPLGPPPSRLAVPDVTAHRSSESLDPAGRRVHATQGRGVPRQLLRHDCPEPGDAAPFQCRILGGKLQRNVTRDRDSDEQPKALGWTAVSGWEHEACNQLADRVVHELGEAGAAQVAPSRNRVVFLTVGLGEPGTAITGLGSSRNAVAKPIVLPRARPTFLRRFGDGADRLRAHLDRQAGSRAAARCA